MKQLIAIMILVVLGSLGYLWYTGSITLPTNLSQVNVESVKMTISSINKTATDLYEDKQAPGVDVSSSQKQVQVLAERAQTALVETRKVLGDSVQVNSDATPGAKDKSVREKAIDHSVYLYCKSFVAEYETNNP